MIVFLGGPLDFWWNENWETPAHIAYMEWREHVHNLLVQAGHLVYRPDRAFKGAWNEAAQVVNNAALEVCDVFIYLTPPGVPAHGTEAEREKAVASYTRVAHVPPGDLSRIPDLIIPLDDPYGDVHRKSYT